jgi:threonine/homoserine/homoserine lactone efflux protein
MRGQLASLVLFAVAVTFTPGPNVVLITACAANFGFRKVVPQMLGITLTFGAMAVASGLGLVGIVQAEPRAYQILKYGGAAYLLYLAWRIGSARSLKGTAPGARPISFVEASTFTALNPKAWVSVLGAVAAYTTLENLMLETLAIAAILSASCLLSCIVWAGFGTALGRFLQRPQVRVAFNWSMAALLISSLVPIVLQD